MRFLASFVTSAVVSFAFLNTAFGNVHNSDASLRRRHAERSPSLPLLGRNVSSATEGGVATLNKRFDGARFSFYDAGLGACGGHNTNNDFIVALNHAQFDSGDFCFKTITINYKGKSTQAQIVDKCMECPFGALDFSRGLFDFFASQDEGYIYGAWNLGSGAPKPTPKPDPTTTKEKPTPTPTPTTSTTTTKKTTTTTRPTSTSSSSSSVVESKTSSTTSTTTMALPTDVFSQLNQGLLNLGGVVIGAGAAGQIAQ
ncbi:expansin family protein [Lyophyllum atratum]|nr:expansin family protein [Lyophyllum atratum]